MVEIGLKLNISHNTPWRDIIKAFQAVWSEEGLLSLGAREFYRTMQLVIREVESIRFARGAAVVE